MALISTWPGRTPQEGTAALRIEGGPTQTFVAGAVLASGARLAEIYSDKVILQRGSSTTVLSMRGAAQVDVEVASAPPQKLEPTTPITNRLPIALRLSPAYENEAFIGLELYPGSNRALFAQLGLRLGDVLVAVDGVPISDYISGTQILEPLADGASMSLTVRRSGDEQLVQVDGSSIVSALMQSSVQTAVQPTMQLPPG